MRARCGFVALALLAAWQPLAAHVGDDAAGDALALRWSADPDVLLPLLLSAGAYAGGVARAWRVLGRGRGIGPRRVATFAIGWGVLALALLSPLDVLGLQLFSLHMLQHELLMVVAAPLLCAGRPLVAWWWLLPPAGRGAWRAAVRQPAWSVTWRSLSAPWTAWALHAVVLWGWHLPVAFEAALLQPRWHTLQHVCFLAGALLYWWSVLRPAPRAQQGVALLSLFTTLLHTSALGALLALAPHPWYPLYAQRSAAWGIDALTDQQLGGLVMWAPAGLSYALAALAVAARWIGLRAAVALQPDVWSRDQAT
jgi:putative membrane protein